MMSYEEALELMEEHCENVWCNSDCDYCKIASAKVALRKQIPKFPAPDEEYGNKCPSCGDTSVDYPQLYCLSCGQKLTWTK